MSHRLDRSRGGEWHPSNILHICRECHQRHHSNNAEAYANGWRLPGNSDPNTYPAKLAKGWMILDNFGGATRTSLRP